MKITHLLAALLLSASMTTLYAQSTTRSASLTPALAALDTIITERPVPADSFSCAAGAALASNLQSYIIQRMGVDPAYIDNFINGLRAVPDEAYSKQMTAYAAGLTIALQNRQEIIPQINQQATGKVDSNYVIEPLFIESLAQGLKQSDPAKAQEAQTLVQRQIAYQNQVYQYANTRFLVENAQKSGVVTLPSGLQYRVLEKGQGAVATDSSTVEVHYEGKLIDGTIFDSSYQRGQTIEFKPTQVIKGWTEALCLMPEGSTWELFIPYDLAYGANGNQSIPGYSTLIFKVQVIKVK